MMLLQKVAVVLLSCLLSLSIPANSFAAPRQSPSSAQMPTQAPGYAGGQSAQPDEYAPLTEDELDGLVAPIALYPDPLVAQVLGAATFPDQIPSAALWLKDNTKLTGESLMKSVDQQPWDPAVKALTQFPSVLDNMAKNLAWTSALGEASATQQADVMAAIQRMRAKANAAGNLRSSPEIKVVQETPQTIVIQPATPQVVYVPTYNPTIIYGAPVVVPSYVYYGPSTAAVISFGAGIAVGAAISGGCCGWGWGMWGTSWHSRTVIYNRNVYVGNPYWRGGYYGGGYRPPGYRPGYPGYPGYRPRPGGYPRPTPYNPGNRPGTNPGNRPNPGRPSTTPVPGNPSTRPSSGAPSTRPAPGNGGVRPGPQPSTRPSTPDARGYQRPQASTGAARQPAVRPNAFSGSAGGRAESVRGNQSMKSGGGANRGGGARR